MTRTTPQDLDELVTEIVHAAIDYGLVANFYEGSQNHESMPPWMRKRDHDIFSAVEWRLRHAVDKAQRHGLCDVRRETLPGRCAQAIEMHNEYLEDQDKQEGARAAQAVLQRMAAQGVNEAHKKKPAKGRPRGSKASGVDNLSGTDAGVDNAE